MIDRNKLYKILEFEEGYRKYPYKDTKNLWTVGIGRCIDTNPIPGRTLEDLKKNGVSKEEAYKLLDHEIDKIIKIASKYEWFNKLDEVRQLCILNILYIKPKAIAEWIELKPKLISALEKKEFDLAADFIKELKMRKDIPNRIDRISNMMKTGIFDVNYKIST